MPPNDPRYLELELWEIEKEFHVMNYLTQMEMGENLEDTFEGDTDEEIQDEVAGWTDDLPDDFEEPVTLEELENLG